MLGLPARPARRRPSLTPMIDVVFLLLVFFMLAARFGAVEAIPLALGGSGAGYQGPPRLVSVGPDRVRLNGIDVTDLPAALAPLMARADDIVVIRPEDGADVERLAGVLAALRAAGLTSLAVLEPAR